MAGMEGEAALLPSLLRRIRRTADLSQRQLAAALGVDRSTIARAESGARDLPVRLLVGAARLAGLRLALVDHDDAELAGMAPGAVRDRAGRRFPAHLDTRHGDDWWWHGSERYSRERPTYTFDRDRVERDARRAALGMPSDHQEARPGDSLERRAWVRWLVAETARRARQEQRYQERLRRGYVPGPDFTCTCPPACDDLLVADEVAHPRYRSVPHVDDCPCRCDIA